MRIVVWHTIDIIIDMYWLKVLRFFILSPMTMVVFFVATPIMWRARTLGSYAPSKHAEYLVPSRRRIAALDPLVDLS